MATKVVVLADLDACVSCVQIVANGEDTSQPDNGVAHGQKMMAHYGAGCLSLVVACTCGDDLWTDCKTFSTVPCGVCGETLAGERHKMAELGRTKA